MILYHYTDQIGFMGIFNSRVLWATKVHYLNDKSEYYLATKIASRIIVDRISVIYGKLESGLSSGEFENNLKMLFAYQAFNSRIEAIFDINLCVCSLTEQGDLLSQWRGYSKNIGGYSIGFDLEEIKAIAKKNGFDLVKCIYDESVHQEKVELIINKAIEIAIMEEGDFFEKQCANYFEEELIKLAPTLKDKSFSEEAEWRLVSIVPTKDLAFRPGKSMIIPYSNISLGDKKELRRALKEVIVGHTPDVVLAQRATKLFLIKELIESSDYPLTYSPFNILGSAVPYRSW